MRQQRAQNERKEAAQKAKDWKQTTLEQSAKRKAQAQKLGESNIQSPGRAGQV